jgi:hypothetical protein
MFDALQLNKKCAKQLLLSAAGTHNLTDHPAE